MPKDPHNHNQNDLIIEKIKTSDGKLIFRKYFRGRPLGKGGFANCIEVTDIQTKQQFAAKIVAKSSITSSKTKKKLITQIKIHKSLSHQNIVKYRNAFEDQDNVYILLQLCRNHTLNDLLRKRKKITEKEAKYYLSQILRGSLYIHDQKIIHRDLKLSNLMIDDKMIVKIGDFGLATKVEYSQEKKKTMCGTPNYIAPEILKNVGHSFEVDLWSIGIIIYTLLFGKPPFETSDMKTTYSKIKRCQYTFPNHTTISKEAKNLIESLLVLDPSKRLTLDEILAHDFMKEEIPTTLPATFLVESPPDSFLGSLFQNLNIRSGEKTVKVPPIMLECQKNSRIVPEEEEEKNKTLPVFVPEVHVICFVDFDSKYGYGYVLSDGSVGVLFNDQQKIILSLDGETFYYSRADKKNGEKEKFESYEINNYPNDKDINKRVTLLLHFNRYLSSKNKNFQFVKSNERVVYVKKVMKTRYAMIFRINNKIVQAIFNDKSQLILSSYQKRAFYKNAQGEKVSFALNEALTCSNPQFKNKLKYLREVLLSYTSPE